MRAFREFQFHRVKLVQERVSFHAISRDRGWLDSFCPTHQLPEIIPVEGVGIVEFRHEYHRVEGVACLPELEHEEPADQGLVEGPCRKHSHVLNVPRFAALVQAMWLRAVQGWARVFARLLGDPSVPAGRLLRRVDIPTSTRPTNHRRPTSVGRICQRRLFRDASLNPSGCDTITGASGVGAV